jgi:hypothetical protein
VKNGKTTGKLRASDKGNDLQDNSDDSRKMLVQKSNKVLENINE